MTMNYHPSSGATSDPSITIAIGGICGVLAPGVVGVEQLRCQGKTGHEEPHHASWLFGFGEGHVVKLTVTWEWHP